MIKSIFWIAGYNFMNPVWTVYELMKNSAQKQYRRSLVGFIWGSLRVFFPLRTIQTRSNFGKRLPILWNKVLLSTLVATFVTPRSVCHSYALGLFDKSLSDVLQGWWITFISSGLYSVVSRWIRSMPQAYK